MRAGAQLRSTAGHTPRVLLPLRAPAGGAGAPAPAPATAAPPHPPPPAAPS